MPTTADVAHGYMECSNNGICQHSTGTCKCRSGFEGVACDKVSCPVASGAVCSGHGSCHTISQLAGMATGRNDWSESNTYGASATAATWDASLIQGCHCLRHYYFGPYLSDIGDYFDYACGQGASFVPLRAAHARRAPTRTCSQALACDSPACPLLRYDPQRTARREMTRTRTGKWCPCKRLCATRRRASSG
mgnify:CR=1 FL=1